MPGDSDKSWWCSAGLWRKTRLSLLWFSHYSPPPMASNVFRWAHHAAFFSEYNGHRVLGFFTLSQNHGPATSCERAHLDHQRTSKQ